ncbi:MAG: MBOAT family protein [Candidatus Omnitrophica bacterium]|nr:MBOAT family protein [Candidatus Omnitrophota bacterium]
MLFNSAPFLVFFPVVTVLYFLYPHSLRWALLLVASCIFYMWFIPQYLLILFLLITIDYSMGILIEDARLKGAHAKKYLIVSILATCSVLFFFKYFNFFSLNLTALGDFFDLHYPAKIINFILPIGLSFHTFQSLSYVIEVYRGRQKAEHHFGIYALYVMFYPQLVAGPIERPYNLIPQFREKHNVDYQRIADALKQMAWGMFKKVVIADRLAVLVNQVCSDVHGYQGPEFVVASLLCPVLFYCDFSGYSDIAVGSAKAMGYRITNNFNFPFFSRSMDEWWWRWNITLYSWIRDYIYIPLCQSRILRNNRAVNVLIAFLLSGLWHGAAWTYVIWGAINGCYLIFSTLTYKVRKGIHGILGLKENGLFLKIWQTAATYLLFSLAGIFFISKSVGDAVYIFSRLTCGWNEGYLKNCFVSLGFDRAWWTHTSELLVVLFIMDLLQQNAGEKFVFAKDPVWCRWMYYYGLVLAMVFWGHYGRNPFIYFQF